MSRSNSDTDDIPTGAAENKNSDSDNVQNLFDLTLLLQNEVSNLRSRTQNLEVGFSAIAVLLFLHMMSRAVTG